MPYEGEFAQYRSIKRLSESERVKALLGSYRIRHSDPKAVAEEVIRSDVKPSLWKPRRVLAVDGSHIEVPIVNGFPGAEASYVTVASVLIDIAKMRELDADRPVDPKDFRETEKADSIDCALPGCNVVGENDHSARESLRRKVFEVIGSSQAMSEGETLLDTFEVLLAYKPQTTLEKEPDCPYSHDQICQSASAKYKRGSGCYKCPCSLNQDLFSTDALRFHEGMEGSGSNGAMYAEIMQVLERIWIIHVLRMMERKEWLGVLRDMAIVLDGPLAVFGHPAWLSQAISQELSRINEIVKKKTGGFDILLLGVEKTGMFVQHFDQLDLNRDGNSGQFPSTTVALLTDAYIKKNIIFSESTRMYGEQSYFGRKFFYKTTSGAKIVGTLPFLNDWHADLNSAEPDQFPRLADALALLDQVVSSRYPNAISPLISAHAEAAIPLNLGKRVLEELAREFIREEQ